MHINDRVVPARKSRSSCLISVLLVIESESMLGFVLSNDGATNRLRHRVEKIHSDSHLASVGTEKILPAMSRS